MGDSLRNEVDGTFRNKAEVQVSDDVYPAQ